MKLEGDYLFEAPVDVVWSALMDPVVLAAVMPGCDKLELVDGRFVGELNIKIGPVQGKFAGKVELKDVEAPSSYTMIIDGRGAPGFVKATAKVRLAADGNGTRMRYDADAQVGGKIASIGQRLIDASAKAIAKQSLDGLHANVKLRAAVSEEETAEAEPSDPEPEPKPEPEPESASDPESESAPAEKESVAKGPAVTAPPMTEPTVKTKPAKRGKKAKRKPVAVIKTDQAAFAASVAKEVGKSLVPAPILYVGVVAVVVIVLWLILR